MRSRYACKYLFCAVACMHTTNAHTGEGMDSELCAAACLHMWLHTRNEYGHWESIGNS